VRFRIDGVLYDTFTIPKAVQEEVLSRVKVLGNMNIAEKRLPQDGRSTVQLGDRLIDLRIASLPTSFGERIVVRLLDKSARLYTLGELGLNEKMLERFRRLIHLEHGLVLVTGPTGAGKSTTLYAALQEIDTKNRNVVTLEDPIEYQLEGISQTQVNERKGLTFASGLRNVLRQDPDIIMVGEIRDQETAEMAIQSALTGHLVFSTLHTNDAASAVTRLIDLGIEPYLVASSLIGVLAQRLVRRICESCRQEMPAQNLDLFQVTDKSLGTGPHRVFQGRGCATCRSTGYFGRIGVFELMPIDEKIQSLIQKKSDSSQIRQTANQNGMRLLQEDGLEKILAGRTTIEEVIRISMRV
jgi:general secretion pathway protein E